MRPIPKSRHSVAVVILLGVAILAAVHAGLQQRPSDHQIRTGAVIVSMDDSRGFEADGLLGSGELRQRMAPAWPWLIGSIRASRGYDDDITEWFATTAFPLTAIFLLGMYGLLWRQCLSWRAACIGAILSMVVIEPVHSVAWGMGDLRTLTSDGVVVAFAPLIAWILWLRRPSPAILWTFFAIGVLANFNFAAAAVLACIVGIVWLSNNRPGLSDFSVIIGGLLTALVAAAPVLIIWWTTALTPALTPAPPDDRIASILVSMALNGPTVPASVAAMMAGLFELSTLTRLLVLAIPAATVAVGFERFHVRNLRLWLAMITVCIAGATVFTILAAVQQDSRAASLLLAGNFIRFTMLPLYILFTQAMVHISRSGLRHSLGWALAVLMVFWLAPSDNMSWPRHQIEDMVSSLMPEKSRPSNVLNRASRRERYNELQAIARWLKLNTPRGGRIICEHAELRLLADRPLLAADEDLAVRALLDNDHGAAVRILLKRQRDLLNPPNGKIDLAKLTEFARENNATAVIVPAWVVPEASGKQWPMAQDGAWGVKLRIFLPMAQDD